jgi:DNA-binding IscR family transcriptional regulator
LRRGADQRAATGRGNRPARPYRAEAGQQAFGRRLAEVGARRAITLADIIEAVEGPIALAPCSTPVRQDCTCSLEKDCTVRPHWPVVDAALRGALSAVPLTQFARPIAAEATA